MPDYTKWFTAPDVNNVLLSAGITTRTAERVNALVLAVINQIERKTLRQFVQGAPGEVRSYDGTNSPEMEVDEMTALTQVTILGMQNQPGFPLENVTLVWEQGKPQTRLQLAKGSLPAFAPSGIWQPYMSIFPAGRQNVLVTGTFGFDVTIPADLWEAGCSEVASRLTREAIFYQLGQVTSQREEDEQITLRLPDPNDPAGWTSEYRIALKDYKRPTGRRLRNFRNRPM